MTGPGTIALAAGGTGGHVFPARALADALSARGWKIALITDSRGASFSDEIANADTYRIRAASLGGGVCSKLKGLAQLCVGLVQAFSLLRRIRPAAVVGFGGYASAPTMWAASRMGIPTMIHEQNGVLGRANRIIAARARRIATSFPDVAGIRDADLSRVVLTGNPVRAEIASVADTPYAAPDCAGGPVHLLVFGGSQGARVLSEIVPAALASLPGILRSRLSVVQQCRPEDLAAVNEAYRAAGIDATLQPFFDDMPSQIAMAHLVIARAGASTVSELAAAGRPAILIPYRFAIDDHQTANARAMAQGGGAWIMPEPDFTATALSQRLTELIVEPANLSRAADCARASGHADAAERLADAAETIARAANDNGANRETAA